MRKEEAKFNEKKLSPRFLTGKENIGFQECKRNFVFI